MAKTFLDAEWRKLIMINYAVDSMLLKPYIPYKTEFDFWRGTCYLSLVGFMFLNTRVKGFKIPFHVNFEEVNLRFYVRHKSNGAWKRGVVFVKEIVPKSALTFVANTLYGEHYQTLRMGHSWLSSNDSLAVEYKWKGKQWNSMRVTTNNRLKSIHEGSEEEFITEHYWGYTRISDKKTSEYEVEHPRWEVYETKDYAINVDFENIYGQNFSFLQQQTPQSVFLAEGSAILVKEGMKI